MFCSFSSFTLLGNNNSVIYKSVIHINIFLDQISLIQYDLEVQTILEFDIDYSLLLILNNIFQSSFIQVLRHADFLNFE